ncbi:MAG TPA: SMP-30/gluconolactonase/LRE family protein [Verrucomicrobiae bacterium]|nr:SMP-30/gluconolactonase/LRE family protein [Verrucomicrobiae bacterium]
MRLQGLMLGGLFVFAIPIAGAVQFQISDAVEFQKIINTNAVFATNAIYNYQIEGAVWIPNGQFLVFSDMGNNKLKELDPSNNMLSDYFLEPTGAKYNGNILDGQERLISCESGSSGFKVVMTTNVVVGTSTGTIVPLVTSCNGLKFISPNDVCIKSDGSIWFTDTGSDSGIALGTSGYQPGYYVYRFYQINGSATVVPVITNGLQRPNGICFSPDETKLYVADDGINWNMTNIMVYNVTSSNTLTGGAIFCTVNGGFADGFRCDVDGRIWSTAGDGVEIFAPDGHRIGKILMGSRPNNLCFGGPEYQTLFTVGQPNVCSFPVLVAGAVSIRKLAARTVGNNFYLTWPAPSTGFELQASDSLGAQAAWTYVADSLQATNGLNQLVLPATNTAKFFRLLLN